MGKWVDAGRDFPGIYDDNTCIELHYVWQVGDNRQGRRAKQQQQQKEKSSKTLSRRSQGVRAGRRLGWAGLPWGGGSGRIQAFSLGAMGFSAAATSGSMAGSLGRTRALHAPWAGPVLYSQCYVLGLAPLGHATTGTACALEQAAQASCWLAVGPSVGNRRSESARVPRWPDSTSCQLGTSRLVGGQVTADSIDVLIASARTYCSYRWRFIALVTVIVAVIACNIGLLTRLLAE